MDDIDSSVDQRFQLQRELDPLGVLGAETDDDCFLPPASDTNSVQESAAAADGPNEGLLG